LRRHCHLIREDRRRARSVGALDAAILVDVELDEEVLVDLPPNAGISYFVVAVAVGSDRESIVEGGVKVGEAALGGIEFTLRGSQLSGQAGHLGAERVPSRPAADVHLTLGRCHAGGGCIRL